MSAASRAPLRVGDEAADFELPDQHGLAVRLGDVLTAGPVILAFVPAAFTSVCTGEFRELAARRDELERGGARLVGISCDPKAALRVWDDGERFGFPLLSDFWPHGRTAAAYGVLDASKGVATRATFVIDPARRVRAAFAGSPETPRPFAAYLDGLGALD